MATPFLDPRLESTPRPFDGGMTSQTGPIHTVEHFSAIKRTASETHYSVNLRNAV